MLKDYFINQGVKGVEVTEFIKRNFPSGDYSKIELQRTPLGLKIIIFTNKPGRIIGRGGETINSITAAVKTRFNIENPQIDVKAVENSNLDPPIVAKQIASALERGYNFKKIANLTMKRIMGAGAIGAEIVISGKITGSKTMTAKFIEGYLKHCGQPAKDLVHTGFEEADTRPGKIGVQVKIMREFQAITGEITQTVQKSLVPSKSEDVEEKPKKAVKKEKEKPKVEKKAKPKKEVKKAAPKVEKKAKPKKEVKKAAPKVEKKKAVKKPKTAKKKEDGHEKSAKKV